MITKGVGSVVGSVLAGILLSTLTGERGSAGVGQRYPSERVIVRDSVTARDLVVLTNDQSSNAKIYQTHRQWTSDGQWIVFRSSTRDVGSQAYAVHEQTGDIVQLTEGDGNDTSSLCVARKSMKLVFLRKPQPPANAQVIELNLQALLADAMAGTPKSALAYERVCATFPEGTRPGGGALDANEEVLYVGMRGGDVGQHLPAGTPIWQKREKDRMGTGPGGLRAVDLKTGELRVVIDTPFQVGHVQTNPWVSGEIVYCHETGGDAPQRMWTVRADGSGNRPLFEEVELDWVTHETVVTPDEVMFNLIGHQPRLRARPTGIAVINLRTNAVEMLGQLDERRPAPTTAPGTTPTTNPAPEDFGGFWHCNGSADGRWAVGDTFRGDLWAIDRRDGRRVLLTADHKMKPDHAHPTFSDDGRRVLIQSGKFTDGKKLQLVVVPMPE